MPVVGKLGMEYLCSQNWRLMIIETEHLIIRDFQEKDAVGLLEYLSHPEKAKALQNLLLDLLLKGMGGMLQGRP